MPPRFHDEAGMSSLPGGNDSLKASLPSIHSLPCLHLQVGLRRQVAESISFFRLSLTITSSVDWSYWLLSKTVLALLCIMVVCLQVNSVKLTMLVADNAAARICRKSFEADERNRRVPQSSVHVPLGKAT